MSFAKRLLEQQDAERQAAVAIAVQSGALRVCEFHGEAFGGSGDLKAAYRAGNAKYSAHELGDTFPSRTKMTDAIKAAVEDHPADECPRCANSSR
jgi:hypothetical protein